MAVSMNKLKIRFAICALCGTGIRSSLASSQAHWVTRMSHLALDQRGTDQAHRRRYCDGNVVGPQHQPFALPDLTKPEEVERWLTT